MDWFGTAMRPLAGGYSGETFLVGDGDDQVVLRIYRHNPDRAVVDASLMRLVTGIVPVPRVIDVRPAQGDRPAILVSEHLRGRPLDQVLASPPVGFDLARLGVELGQVLARLSGVPFLHPGGFAGAGLALSSSGWPDDLLEFAQGYRDSGRLAAWTGADWDGLVELINLAGDVLDDAGDRTVLVHSDFNPKNIVVGLDRFEVVGLVDWEFAHAGSPYTDIGNFSRFERDGRLIEPLIGSFLDAAPGHLPDPLTGSRAADLWALVELAGGVPSNPVRELAAELLLAQARAGDLTAWPFDGVRVGPRA